MQRPLIGDQTGNDPLNLIDALGLSPDSPEASGGWVASAQNWLQSGTNTVVPGAFYANLAQEQYSQGNYGTAAVYGVASLVDAAIGVITFGESTELGTSVRFAAESAPSFSAIGSTGQVGEQWLTNNLAGTSQAYFSTSQGARYVDQFANGIANESKVGYTSSTSSVQAQIAKDVELMQTQQVQGVNWHFFDSPVTGRGGPSQPLLNSLQQNGINVILH